MVNNRVWLKAADLNQPHLSVTILSSIQNDPPFIFDIREHSNSGVDFCTFVISALCQKYFWIFVSINLYRYLNPGDFLILDNASVHKNSQHLPFMVNLLQSFDITLVFLPTYSPELNPVELLFNTMKRFISNTYTGDSIELRICSALSLISRENVINYYLHSLNKEVIKTYLENII